MLTELSIRDVVLIDKLDLCFTGGLTVLTGETGAGKSILLDALGLALGQRADARLVRHGQERAAVAATFSLRNGHPALALLRDQGLEAEETLLLRRILGADGRSRAWANDQPVSIGLLRQLGQMLIEVQGQFDQTGLMNPATHGGILDSHGGLTGQRDGVAAAWNTLRKARAALEAAEQENLRIRRDEDWLRHMLAELEKLAPRPGEEDALTADRAVLRNAGRVTEAAQGALGELEKADAALRQAQGRLARLGDGGGPLGEAAGALDRAVAESQEALAALQALAETAEGGEDRLTALEERLFALREAARKHGAATDELPAVLDRLRHDLARLEDGAVALENLRKQADTAQRNYDGAAQALSAARRRAAEALDAAVNAELPPLRLEKARFMTGVSQRPPEKSGASGQDDIHFQVAANPGQPAGPLAKTASGGELSRFLLAIRVALANQAPSLPTLIFDEVDRGVGGATAAAVGERLARLAAGAQILVVTHSPQVAALGAQHLRVAKTQAAEQTLTEVTPLQAADRLEELARMLAGAEITAEARAAAKRLLETPAG